MTFEKLIKLLNILDNDGEILVMEDIGYPKEVCNVIQWVENNLDEWRTNDAVRQ